MANPVSICNMALGFFAGGRVSGIQDADLAAQGDEAALCNAFYDDAVQACHEDGAWLFATKFVDLGAPSDSPYKQLLTSQNDSTPAIFGGSGAGLVTRPLLSQFVMPNDMITPLGCDDGSGTFTIEWERNGPVILSEETAVLLCKGVFRVDDPNLWTPNFRFAVAYKLASLIVGPLTQSQAKIKQYEEYYKEAVKRARMLDGQAGATTQKIGMKSESLANRRR